MTSDYAGAGAAPGLHKAPDAYANPAPPLERQASQAGGMHPSFHMASHIFGDSAAIPGPYANAVSGTGSGYGLPSACARGNGNCGGYAPRADASQPAPSYAANFPSVMPAARGASDTCGAFDNSGAAPQLKVCALQRHGGAPSGGDWNGAGVPGVAQPETARVVIPLPYLHSSSKRGKTRTSDPSNSAGAGPGASDHHPQQHPQPKRVGRKPKVVSFEDIAKHFDKPIEQAVRSLGACTTVVKKVCRANGVQRWPFRKIQSVVRPILLLQARVAQGIASREEVDELQRLVSANGTEAAAQGSPSGQRRVGTGSSVPTESAGGSDSHSWSVSDEGLRGGGGGGSRSGGAGADGDGAGDDTGAVEGGSGGGRGGEAGGSERAGEASAKQRGGGEALRRSSTHRHRHAGFQLELQLPGINLAGPLNPGAPRYPPVIAPQAAQQAPIPPGMQPPPPTQAQLSQHMCAPSACSLPGPGPPSGAGPAQPACAAQAPWLGVQSLCQQPQPQSNAQQGSVTGSAGQPGWLMTGAQGLQPRNAAATPQP